MTLVACVPARREIVQPEVAQPGSGTTVRNMPGSTRKICQLISEVDHGSARPLPVANHTEQRAHLLGTDLGVSFAGPGPGEIHFLFGDTVPETQSRHAIADDAVAVARADADPDRCLDLTFYADAQHEYTPIRLNGFQLGIFDVPTSAFVVNGVTFGTFATNAGGSPLRPTRSVLGIAEQFPRKLTFDYVADLPPSKLMNVATVLVDDSWRPSAQPTRVLFFGTGLYRSARNVWLAAFPLGTLRTGAHVWFAGRSGGERVPGTEAGWAPGGDATWASAEQQARPLFDHDGADCMGELSVTWNRYLQKWLMLYNCSQPRGIVFRVAPQPWGPWSEPRVLFDPRADHGYCVFMHDEHPERDCPQGSPNPRDDLVSRDHGSNQYGGEYGPYVIDAFTRGSVKAHQTTIYFTMSTWNPYAVVLMKSTLAERSVPYSRALVFNH